MPPGVAVAQHVHDQLLHTVDFQLRETIPTRVEEFQLDAPVLTIWLTTGYPKHRSLVNVDPQELFETVEALIARLCSVRKLEPDDDMRCRQLVKLFEQLPEPGQQPVERIADNIALLGQDDQMEPVLPRTLMLEYLLIQVSTLL